MTATVVEPVVIGEEPKLRARRIEVRRAGRRHRNKVLAILAAVLLVAAAGAGVVYSPLLAVDHLDVEGVRHLDPSTVLRVGGLAKGQHLVSIDTGAAEHDLSKLPWVRRATVSLRWPNTVDVRITERQPVAVAVVRGGARLVVTADGVVAGGPSPLDANLPVTTIDPALTVKVGHPLPAGVALAVEMVGALPESLASKSTGSTIKQKGEVDVALKGGATLVLGTGEDAAEKFIAAESILGGAVVLSGLKKADVSVPSAPVIVRGA